MSNKTEKQLLQTLQAYHQDNKTISRYLQASKEFDVMINSGWTQKRGNQISSRTCAIKTGISFNTKN